MFFILIKSHVPFLVWPIRMKIRVIAEISDEIHEVFPYLNAILKGCIYNHPALTLTIKKGREIVHPPCAPYYLGQN